MEHILDNPIWYALKSGNKRFASGNEWCKFFDREVGAFAGLKNNSEKDLAALRALTPAGSKVVLFTPEEITIPRGWQILVCKPLLQMIYLKNERPAPDGELVPLEEKHVPAMLDLTGRTNPGPFLIRTIEFGNYKGVFEGEQLVAMTGQRLHPSPYVEVSAVCTDPSHTGKGYAGRLIRDQIRTILANSETPFLHVLPENTGAVNLYRKIGFETRKQIVFYVLEREC